MSASIVLFRIYKDATVTGTAFSDVNTTASVTEFSTAGTYTANTGLLLNILPIHTRGNHQSLFMPLDVYSIILYPGETLTLTAQSLSGVVDIIASLSWCEEF